MLTVNDLMARFNVKKTAVYSMVERGDIPKPLRVGGSSRWLEDEIDAAVEAMKVRRAVDPMKRSRGRPRKEVAA